MRSLILLLLLCGVSRGDSCIIEFTAPKRCAPCKQMEPIVSELKRTGLDIRVVDVDDEKNQKLVEGYEVPSVPYFVFVYETPAGWRRGGVIRGACTAGQLRRLAVVPKVAETGAAARNCVRALFSPVPLLEW